MAFDTTVITSAQHAYRAGQLWISWTTTAPSGTPFQVYLDGRLAWSGTKTRVAIVAPDGRQRVDVGTVAAGEEGTDFSAGLASPLVDRAALAWLGGTYLDATGNDDVAGFRVYGEPTPGGGINLTTPLADLPAYPGGIITDGYGLGGYGSGGYGRAASAYAWQSAQLGSGTWHYAVRSYDAAGNLGTSVTASIHIATPPQPPARDAAGSRLRVAYDPVTHKATLTWLASVG